MASVTHPREMYRTFARGFEELGKGVGTLWDFSGIFAQSECLKMDEAFFFCTSI